MPENRQPIPTISDDGIAGMTGKTVHEWCALMDCAGGLWMDPEELVRQFADRFVRQRYALVLADRYRKARAMIPGADGPLWLAVFHRFNSPWHYVYRSFTDQQQAWFPPGDFQEMERAPSDALRGLWNGSAGLDFAFRKTGHFETEVMLEITGLPDLEALRAAETAWRVAFEKLSDLMTRQVLP